jgi:hypothetical protein
MHAMRTDRAFAVFLLVALVILQACSASPVRQKIDNRNPELDPVHQAWRAARVRLHSMCPHVPKSVEELTRALKSDGANGCFARLAKDTHTVTVDDWHWHWLPPYQVVVAVHDEELRKRLVPKLHDEYMLGLMRYLAEKADRDEITAEQLRYAVNAGWSWLNGKMQEEPVLLQEKMRRADEAATRKTMTTMAGGLATVATLALAVSAGDKEYKPTPANCYAYLAEQGSYTVHCY